MGLLTQAVNIATAAQADRHQLGIGRRTGSGHGTHARLFCTITLIRPRACAETVTSPSPPTRKPPLLPRKLQIPVHQVSVVRLMMPLPFNAKKAIPHCPADKFPNNPRWFDRNILLGPQTFLGVLPAVVCEKWGTTIYLKR